MRNYTFSIIAILSVQLDGSFGRVRTAVGAEEQSQVGLKDVRKALPAVLPAYPAEPFASSP
jgi:hypothetical protein